MASWEYNCPKFANLAASMDESISELEKYFEVDHEDEARNRRTTRRAAAATAASGGTRDPKVEQPVQKPPSTPKTKAGCRLTRQKERKVVDTCREAPVLSDATAEPPEPARESLTICEITGKGNRNMDKSEERSNSASTSAVKSCKRETSTRKRILAHHPVIPSLNGNDVAMKMEEPPSKVSKPNALPAAKKSGAPLDAKKHVVLPPVRQHARSSASSKSAVAVPAKKVVTPALRKPPAERLQSLAELVVNFHNKTPTRFRRVPKDPGGEQHGVAFKKPTIPVTPKLATLMRSRSASLRDQKRKAEEVNVCVSNSKKSKVEAVRAKAKVAPGSRPALRPKNVEQDLMVSKLSTKPPQKKLAKTPALRDVSKRLTVAMSPAFALKLRSETWKKRKEAEQKANGPTGSSAEAESTAGTMKTKPRRKGATAMGKSETLKNYTKSKADESVSGATTSQSTSSKNVSQKGNSAVNSHKKGKTLTSAASKEKSGTKGGSAKRKKPLAAAKMTRRASSSHHVSTVIKPHLQGISEKLSQPVKTFRSGKVQLQRPIKMNAQDRPQEKMKDKKPVKIAATQSSSGSETEKPTHFKAKPAPDRSRVFRLRNMSAPVTKPKPFRLASLERHQECMLEFQKKKERIEAERLQKTKFIARPVPRSNRERPESVDRTVVRATKPGPSEHISRPRRR